MTHAPDRRTHNPPEEELRGLLKNQSRWIRAEAREEEQIATLVAGALHALAEILHFISVDYMAVRQLVHQEYDALVERGVADQWPHREVWLRDLQSLRLILNDPRIAQRCDFGDVFSLVERLVGPLSTNEHSRTFAGTVLSSPASLRECIDSTVRDLVALASPVNVRVCYDLNGSDDKALVLFPKGPLKDLLSQLIENANKHRMKTCNRPSVEFLIEKEEGEFGLFCLSASYKGTKAGESPNNMGGLSSSQWGGALEAFGGRVEIVQDPQSGSYSFVTKLSLLPFGRPS